ncbi:mitochondrial 54S ribosomal protein bL35m SCDLUD_002885 [Saccharomycodes ludwigii]|uniref:mitochondrial 54S ribosomal protein bL35m n=1 Tax=Saccharomycodes ludwigii TaxID=36035 RepID=UPI001E86625F|nr:hypothetical protein SCDLUD_002885 [Saccharomycodes ludwigii]KAH3901393.1 hypothetical protein SCDLUD_002885 [Saccharomycodes ludwigii]
MLNKLLSPILSLANRSCTFVTFTNTSLIFTRSYKLKTHKGAAKRWLKTANSWKRGHPGRKHGNAGWGKANLKQLDGKTLAHSSHLRRLKKLLPYS